MADAARPRLTLGAVADRPGAQRLQRVVLLPTGADDPAADVGRPAVALTAPDAPARARATGLGLPVVVCPELAAEPGEVPGDRAHRLDTLVRRHAVADRWRDLVVVADDATLRDVATGLCDLPEASTWPGSGGAVVVGLPRGTRPLRLGTVAAAALVVGVLALLAAGRLHPLSLPAVAAAAGAGLLLPSRTRHAGRTLLAAAGFAAVLVLLAVAGSTRFPVQ